jgi:hypothetical protein
MCHLLTTVDLTIVDSMMSHFLTRGVIHQTDQKGLIYMTDHSTGLV